MSQEETLQMVARARDNASGPMRKIEAALKNLGKRGHEQSKGLHEGFAKVHKQLDRVAEVAREGVAPALGVIGISSLTAVGGMAALIENMRKFADQGADVAAFGRKVQLTANTIRGLEGAASEFNVDPNAVRQGEQGFAQAMYMIRRHRGELYAHLVAQRRDVAQELAATPETVAGNETALKTFLKLIENVKDVHGEMTARAFSQEAFGTDAFVDLLRKGNAALEKSIELHLKLKGAQDPEAGEKWVANWSLFSDAVEGLRNAVGNELLPDFTELADQATQFFSVHKKEIADDITAGVRGMGHALLDIKQLLPSIEEGFHDVHAVISGIASVWRVLKMTPGQAWTELTGGTVPDDEIRLRSPGELPHGDFARSGGPGLLTGRFRSKGQAAADVVKGLRERGLDPAHAALLAGNIQQESNFDPTLPNVAEGGIGYIQWRLDRRKALDEFAAKRHTLETDAATQLDFLMQELRSTPSGRAFLAAGSINDMNRSLHGFIRYGDSSESQRLAYGRSLLAAASDAGMGGGATKVTGSAAITVDVNAPKGTAVKANADGLFDTVKVNRGVAMPLAESGGSW